MVSKYMRWQVLMAAVGIVAIFALLGVASASVETVVEPEPGGSFIEGVPNHPINLNPLYAQTNNAAEQDMLALVFNSLTDPNINGNMQPDLARRWTISEDDREYTFYLRDDVVWHDGYPFTADDVAYTVSVIQDPNYGGSVPAVELWREVSVEVVSDYVIRFTLPAEVAPFAPFLSYTTFSILPAHLLSQYSATDLPTADFSRFPIGTGAWIVKSVTADEAVLVPNRYDKVPDPMLDDLVLRFYNDSDEALEALEAGDVLGVGQVAPSDTPRILRDSDITPYSSFASGYTALFFNLRNPLFQRHDIRQAFLEGLDRQTLISRALQGQAVPADAFLMPTHWAYIPDLPRYDFDLEAATQLLDKEGWVDNDGDGIREREGTPVEFTILTTASDPALVDVVNEIVRQYSALGVKAVPQVVSTVSELRDILKNRDFDIFVLSTPATGLPADPDFYPLWHSSQIAENGQNYTSFATEETDLMLVEARLTMDQAERRVIYDEFQRILAEELPAFPLYYPITNYAVSSEVNDVQVGPSVRPADRFNSIATWYIKTRRELRDIPLITPTPEK